MDRKGKPIEEVPAETSHQSGAPEFGGATTSGSHFGGRGIVSAVLRLVARLGRSATSLAYRWLRELDETAGDPTFCALGTREREIRLR